MLKPSLYTGDTVVYTFPTWLKYIIGHWINTK